jgi:hypothetical protein
MRHADIWDTAGQERFQNLHPSYFYKAHACIMVRELVTIVITPAVYTCAARRHRACGSRTEP